MDPELTHIPAELLIKVRGKNLDVELSRVINGSHTDLWLVHVGGESPPHGYAYSKRENLITVVTKHAGCVALLLWMLTRKSPLLFMFQDLTVDILLYRMCQVLRWDAWLRGDQRKLKRGCRLRLRMMKPAIILEL